MIVVADTTPLNYLILLGFSDALREIYGRVLVPHAVLKEMLRPEAPEAVRRWAMSPPSWIEEVHVGKLDPSLPSGLGAGEREAISFALVIGADVVLIDEQLGRRQAEMRNLKVAGTFGLLFEMSMRGVLDFPAAVRRLSELGFHASPQLEARMLARYDDAKRKGFRG
ncbi:hypothetical protein [Granulicella rosea]|uniref:hypothetical protein n=1 Tax=Granulicella rosea TaxID=474952 RepID=UPI000B7956C9|nr:hypothetical protein [Granulicella rosea]